MLATLSLLVTIVAALDPSQCMRSDAALSTSTLTNLDAFNALASAPSSVSASGEGLAIVADETGISGMVSKSRWALPIEVSLSWKADNIRHAGSNTDIWMPVGVFTFSDANSTPDKDRAVGCSEVGLSMAGPGLDEYAAYFKCCGANCIPPDGKPLMDSDGWNATMGMLSWRGGPMFNDTQAWKVQIATDRAAFIYSDVTHGLSSTKGSWPGGELTLGFAMTPGFSSTGAMPTLSVQSLSITGCAVGVTQTAVVADRTLDTGPRPTPPPTVTQSSQTITTTGSDHKTTVKVVLDSGGSKKCSTILTAILALVVVVAL